MFGFLINNFLNLINIFKFNNKMWFIQWPFLFYYYFIVLTFKILIYVFFFICHCISFSFFLFYFIILHNFGTLCINWKLVMTISRHQHLILGLCTTPPIYLHNPLTVFNAKALPRLLIKVSSQFTSQYIDLMLPNLASLYLMAAKSLKHITVHHTSFLSENIIVELQVTKKCIN